MPSGGVVCARMISSNRRNCSSSPDETISRSMSVNSLMSFIDLRIRTGFLTKMVATQKLHQMKTLLDLRKCARRTSNF